MYQIVREDQAMPCQYGFDFVGDVREPRGKSQSSVPIQIVTPISYQAKYDESNSENLEVSNVFVFPPCVTRTSPPSCLDGKAMTSVANIRGAFSELDRY
jgi:hypothetical protein